MAWNFQGANQSMGKQRVENVSKEGLKPIRGAARLGVQLPGTTDQRKQTLDKVPLLGVENAMS
jgi:hypothetical protein